MENTLSGGTLVTIDIPQFAGLIHKIDSPNGFFADRADAFTSYDVIVGCRKDRFQFDWRVGRLAIRRDLVKVVAA